MKPASSPALRLSSECALVGEERAALERWEEELSRCVQAWDERPRGASAPALRAALAEAGEALQAALAPLLFAQLEAAVGRALAPFFSQYSDAARVYHGTDAAAALRSALAPEPAAEARRLPGQADGLLRWIRAALAGRVEWEFEGAEAAES